MDTKESIEFLKGNLYVVNEYRSEEIVKCLQQGEKYRQMWESIESAKINDKTIQRAIRILIKDIKEKYKVK